VNAISHCILGAAIVALPAPLLHADGTEALGDVISLQIASGTGFVHAGTGLHHQPGAIVVDVPEGAQVKQVLLYWEHQHLPKQADNRIVIDGHRVTGDLIGGPTFFFRYPDGAHYVSAFRTDITDLGLVRPGRNALVVHGLRSEFKTTPSDGAGIFVIYDDPRSSQRSRVLVQDGIDAGFREFHGPRRFVKPVTFEFPRAEHRRFARVGVMVGSVDWKRENHIRVTIDHHKQQVVLSNVLGSTDGKHWDSLEFDIPIPAGAKTLELDLSGRACFMWVAAFLHLTDRRAPLLSSCGKPPEFWAANACHWRSVRPTDTLGQTFGAEHFRGPHASLANRTLAKALERRRADTTTGWSSILVRHGVAALLNASHDGVHYPLYPGEVAQLVQSALDACPGETPSEQASATIDLLASCLTPEHHLLATHGRAAIPLRERLAAWCKHSAQIQRIREARAQAAPKPPATAASHD